MNRLPIYGAQAVLALLLALTLWTYVSFITNPNARRQLPTAVQVVGLPDGLILVDPGTGLPTDLTASTTLTISGPEREIEALSSADFTALINLDDAGPGVSRVPISVEGPDVARVRSREPDEITVRLARELVATVPVTTTLQGQPPFSFSVGRVTQGAREAVVRGPEDLVRRVVAAVATVDLQGQTVDLAATLPLTPVDAMGDPVEGVTITPEEVAVRVPILAQLGPQQVSVVPTLIGQPAPGYAVGNISVDPNVVEVVTSGVMTGTFSTEPIDLTGLTGPITRTVGLQRPPNVITRPADIPVTVRVSIVPIAVTSQLPLPIFVSPTNLGEGLSAPEAEPAAIQVTLAGQFDRLIEVANTPGAVVATVDLSGLGPGTYVLPVQITVPEGLELIAPIDPQVRVTIFPPPATPTPEPSPTSEPSPTPEPTIAPDATRTP